jgi:Domain of unknown function (DUF5615)
MPSQDSQTQLNALTLKEKADAIQKALRRRAVSASSCEYLRSLGHDVLMIQAVGNSEKPDLEVLSFAIADQRAVLTKNRRDFVKIER